MQLTHKLLGSFSAVPIAGGVTALIGQHLSLGELQSVTLPISQAVAELMQQTRDVQADVLEYVIHATPSIKDEIEAGVTRGSKLSHQLVALIDDPDEVAPFAQMEDAVTAFGATTAAVTASHDAELTARAELSRAVERLRGEVAFARERLDDLARTNSEVTKATLAETDEALERLLDSADLLMVAGFAEPMLHHSAIEPDIAAAGNRALASAERRLAADKRRAIAALRALNGRLSGDHDPIAVIDDAAGKAMLAAALASERREQTDGCWSSWRPGSARSRQLVTSCSRWSRAGSRAAYPRPGTTSWRARPRCWWCPCSWAC